MERTETQPLLYSNLVYVKQKKSKKTIKSECSFLFSTKENETLLDLELWKSVFAELLGTTILVGFGCGAVIVQKGEVVPAVLTFCGIVLALIFSLGNYSGAHFNPSVTLGFLLLRRIGIVRSLLYFIAQMIGATLASVYLWFVLPYSAEEKLSAVTMLVDGFSPLNGIIMEAVLTFFLVFTVFMISKEEEEEAEHNNHNDSKGNKKENTNITNEEMSLQQLPHHHTVYHYTVGGGDLLDIKGPLGVISALAACMIFGGPVTRASLNPARSFGPALCSNFWDNQYVYWIGPLSGSILAVLSYKMLTFSFNKNR